MKKSYLLSATITATTAAVAFVPVVSAGFYDIAEETELSYAVNSLVERNIVQGYPDGSFKPHNKLTRAHAAKIIAGVLDLDVENVENPNFKDVPTTHPYYKYIAALANAGIITGDNGHYKPSNTVTRGQMAKILANAYELVGDGSIPFTDVEGSGYEEYVDALFANNVTVGKSDTIFGVRDPVTRGHLALFIYRIESLVVGTDYIVLTAEEYGYNQINIGKQELFSTGAVNVEIDESGDYSSVSIEAIEEGTDYIYFGEYDPYSYTGFTGDIAYYRVEVIERNGQLEMYFTLLEEESAEPGHIMIPSDVSDISLEAVDGRPVHEDDYEMKDVGAEYSNLYVYMESGDYILTLHYDEIEDMTFTQQYGFTLDYIWPKTFVDMYPFTEAELFISEYVIAESLGQDFTMAMIKEIAIKEVLDEEGVPLLNVISVSKDESGIVGEIYGEGISTVTITLIDGFEFEFDIYTQSFGDGYLIDYALE